MTATEADNRAEAFAKAFDAICGHMHHVVQGNNEPIRLVVTCLLAGGHVLVEDVPGMGKTTLAKAMARTVHGTFGRVQFTPDLMPSDIVGTTVWHQGDGSFSFRQGPAFVHMLLADEINRASPKAQSALLEAMGERSITVDGTTYDLPDPFMVIATQNPMEHKGTFPLPESQLDRFLMRLTLGYPSRDDETALLSGTRTDRNVADLQPIVSLDQVRNMANYAENLHASPEILGYVVDLARATRDHPAVELGMSPRSSLGLLAAARVWAAAKGRGWVNVDDVQDLVLPVLAHRLSIRPSVTSATADDVVAELVRTVPAPRGRR